MQFLEKSASVLLAVGLFRLLCSQKPGEDGLAVTAKEKSLHVHFNVH